MDSTYKFSPGQIFKLKPSARVTWLAFANHTRSGITAIRSDTNTGARLLAWINSGRPVISHEEQREIAALVAQHGRDFWPHDLETAVACA